MFSTCCRRHLNIRGKSANLPAITEKDWLDLQFGIEVGVDYYALSFVRSADVYELKAYLAKHGKFNSHREHALRGIWWAIIALASMCSGRVPPVQLLLVEYTCCSGRLPCLDLEAAGLSEQIVEEPQRTGTYELLNRTAILHCLNPPFILATSMLPMSVQKASLQGA